MANGQQLAEENVRRFATWQASKSDEELRSMVVRGSLSRAEIATECGFARSAITQNPRIRDALKLFESDLRARGVLPTLADATETQPATKSSENARGARDAERLSRLERENASLKSENAELKRLLSRFTVLQEALAETGRLPR